MGRVVFTGGLLDMPRLKLPGSLSINVSTLSITDTAPTGTIVVSKAGEGIITAKSDNNSAITVSVSGNNVIVTGITNGQATITISVSESETHKAPQDVTCVVTVNMGILLRDIAEGSLINIYENGVSTPFFVIKHDYESGLNGAGRTLVVRRDSYDDRQWHSSSRNSYHNSSIDSWLNSTYKNLFSSAIQTAMGTTKFYNMVGNGSSSISTYSKSVFLVSLKELGLTHHSYSNEDGSTTLPAGVNLHVVARNGQLSTQWTRTPIITGSGSTSSAFYVRSPSYVGEVGLGGVTSSYGSRPCFTLPDDCLLDRTSLLIKE